MSGGPRISVIMPVRNEAHTLVDALAALQHSGWPDELIIVDGHSEDGSGACIAAWQARQALLSGSLTLLSAAPGRAAQMNAGARHARGEVLLFLHADTRLAPGALAQIRQAVQGGAEWGRFDVCFDRRPQTRWQVMGLIAFFMNWRSALSGVCTGDQALFVRRDIFSLVGGFPLQVLMEDIEMSRRLGVIGWPARIRLPVQTSARRWQQGGLLRTVLNMWRLRLLYFLGVSPGRLARHYEDVR